MMTREEQLDRIRSVQRSTIEAPYDPTRQFRIILEFRAPPDPAAVATAIRERLDIDVEAAGLLEDHGLEGGDDSLARFLAVKLPGIAVEGLPGNPFELSYAIGDAVGALTAEPETHADFFRVPSDGDPSIESVEDFPPGCWVPEAQDPTPTKPHWALDTIRAPTAWNLVPPAGGKARGEGVSVFQPDTGVADHIELEAGMLDLTRAHDFVANIPGAADPMNYSGNPGHGTGTASVVASRAAGTIAGSAPLATLVPLRAVEAVVVFDHGRVAAAVEHARRNGAQVITMSLGGPWSSVLRAAIDAAIRDGVIVLAAAGNCVKIVVWPARYEEVIAVAGSNIADLPWIGSSRGGAVDITAPGEFVPRANRSPSNGGSATSVQGGQGTSFAVAMTAGVAALWLAYHTPAKIRQTLAAGETMQDRFVRLLKASARRPAGFDTSRYGAGIVHAEQLLTLGLAVPPEEGVEVATETADPLHSLKTALWESPVPVLPALEAVAAPLALDDRRFAAELSHLALQQSFLAEGATEAPAAGIAPSPTLLAALTRSRGRPP